MSAARVSATVVALVSVFAVAPACAAPGGAESGTVAATSNRVPGQLPMSKRDVAYRVSLAGVPFLPEGGGQ